MVFYFGEHLTDFLFKGWTTKTLGVFIATCLGIFFLTLFLDVIKFLRAYLHKLATLNPLTFARTEPNLSERSPLVRPLLIPSSQEHMRNRKIKIHVGDSVLHMVQVVAAYLLMLAVMSFNAWIGITVVIASGLGYFLLGPIIQAYTLKASHQHPPEGSSTTSSYATRQGEESSYAENASHQHLQADLPVPVET